MHAPPRPKGQGGGVKIRKYVVNGHSLSRLLIYIYIYSKAWTFKWVTQMATPPSGIFFAADTTGLATAKAAARRTRTPIYFYHYLIPFEPQGDQHAVPVRSQSVSSSLPPTPTAPFSIHNDAAEPPLSISPLPRPRGFFTRSRASLSRSLIPLNLKGIKTCPDSASLAFMTAQSHHSCHATAQAAARLRRPHSHISRTLLHAIHLFIRSNTPTEPQGDQNNSAGINDDTKPPPSSARFPSLPTTAPP